MSSREDLSLAVVLLEVADERQRQDSLWGEQNHPDGTGLVGDETMRLLTQAATGAAYQESSLTWRHILEEEMAEVFAEKDPVLLRKELLQVAAVAAAWVEAIDRRTA